MQQNCAVHFLDYLSSNLNLETFSTLWSHVHTFKNHLPTVIAVIATSDVVYSLQQVGNWKIQWFGHYHNRLWHLERWQSTKWMNHWPLGLHRIYKALHTKQFSCPSTSVENHSPPGRAWRCDFRNERCYKCKGCDWETLTRLSIDQCRPPLSTEPLILMSQPLSYNESQRSLTQIQTLNLQVMNH